MGIEHQFGQGYTFALDKYVQWGLNRLLIAIYEGGISSNFVKDRL